MEGWGPFDLVYTAQHNPWATPVTAALPYQLEFCRVLQSARTHPGSLQPFFWMSVGRPLPSEDDQATAAFLGTLTTWMSGAASPSMLCRCEASAQG